jgi:hypothetical protein
MLQVLYSREETELEERGKRRKGEGEKRNEVTKFRVAERGGRRIEKSDQETDTRTTGNQSRKLSVSD